MDSIFGLPEKALELCEERASLLGSNLANSSTPGYKAKDISFQRVLGEVEDSENAAGSLLVSSPGHLNSEEAGPASILYRVPMQQSLDGNTVDPEIERKNFIQNSLRYQASLTFVHHRTKELLEAIKGE